MPFREINGSNTNKLQEMCPGVRCSLVAQWERGAERAEVGATCREVGVGGCWGVAVGTAGVMDTQKKNDVQRSEKKHR